EAKGTGFDVKTMRRVISLRKMDASDRQEAEFLLDTYLSALGMIDQPAAPVQAAE
ncbi:MAG: GapR family DNA-binding domain-containing protein, partial [Pseudomonadota bacterium]|nr:GapR family DNA-binding domain-containing protein [Pseudomonadota bacterium]